VAGIGWKALKLALDPAGHCSVHRQQARLPAGGQVGAELANYVRFAGDVDTIVEDGVAEKDDMPGHQAPRPPPPRSPLSPGVPEPTSRPAEPPTASPIVVPPPPPPAPAASASAPSAEPSAALRRDDLRIFAGDSGHLERVGHAASYARAGRIARAGDRSAACAAAGAAEVLLLRSGFHRPLAKAAALRHAFSPAMAQ
jgi:hypothetical protein